MPYRNIRGQLIFVFCFFFLSTTTTAQMDIDRLPSTAVKVEVSPTKKRITRRLGPQLKNALAAGRQRAINRKPVARTVDRQRLVGPAYKNKRFSRRGKMTGNTAPRRKQLMGPAYKNRRFKVRRSRVGKFKKRE